MTLYLQNHFALSKPSSRISFLFLFALPLFLFYLYPHQSSFQSILHTAFQKKNTWMLYYTIGGQDVNYVQLLRLQLATLRSFPENDNIDIFVLADSRFADAAKDYFPAGVSTIIHDMDATNCTNKHCHAILASMRKTKVFDLVNAIDLYSAVLFLDVDMVITGPLQPIFENIAREQGKLHVKSDYGGHESWAHSRIYWSHSDYSPEEMAVMMKNNVSVFNAGQFGFCPTKDMRLHFQGLNLAIALHGRRGHFYEQSHMNRYFNPKLLTVRTLEPYVGGPGSASIIVHVLNARLSLWQKLDQMRNTWAYVITRQKPAEMQTRYSLHTLAAANEIMHIGHPEDEFSLYLLNTLKPKAVWFVNSLSNFSSPTDSKASMYEKIVASSSVPHTKIYNTKFGEDFNATIMRNIDFVYLNSLSSYNETVHGLESAFEIMRPGNGWISGIGYNCSLSHVGVKKAAEEFCALHGLRVWYTFQDECTSYAIRM